MSAREQVKHRLTASGILPLLIMSLSLCIAGCRNDAAPGATAGLEEVSLRLKWIPTAGFAGAYNAEHKGFFEEENLAVEIRPGGAQAQPLVLVASGSDDFGVAGADAVLLARAQGVPVVAVAAIFQRNAGGFFTKPGSGIRTPADWRGKRIGILSGNDTESLYRALLERNGIDESEVTEVPIGFDLNSFLTGQIDVQPGYITNQPNLLRTEGVVVNIIDPNEHGVFMLGNVYFTTEETVRERPELVQRFVRAALRGWSDVIQNPTGGLAGLLAADPNLQEATQLQVLRSTIPYLQRPDGQLGYMDPRDWQRTVETLKAAGALEGEIDLSAAYTNDFVDNLEFE